MSTATAALSAVLAVGFLVPGARAQGTRLLSIDDLYHPDKKLTIAEPSSGFVWIDDDSYLEPREQPRSKEFAWLRVEAATGSTVPLFDALRMESALAAVSGVDTATARRLSRSKTLTFSPGYTAIVLTIADDLYLYEIAGNRLSRLTQRPGLEELPAFSPDGSKLAFVRGNNLGFVDLASREERMLTRDGSSDLLNGKLDWVYQEEVYGRGNFRAFWWSPDSKRLAFLQLDESAVPKYTIADDIPYRPLVEQTVYPKAGDPNPKARLGVVGVDSEGPAFVPWGDYTGIDTLIVAVGWTRDSAHVVFSVQDREQTWLDLRLAPANATASRRLLRETTPAWVDNHGLPSWLGDGSFLWFSEASGFKHLYHHRPDGTLVGAVTKGEWEARTLHGVDERKGIVYFSGTARSPIGQDVYRVGLDGNGLALLSQAPGTHDAVFNPSFTRYLDAWSDVVTPPKLRLHRADGSLQRVVDDNPVRVLSELALSSPEFLQVTTRDGFVMEAMMIRPPGFDPKRKYPVLQHAYAGPHAQTVRDKWGGTTYLFHQMLAQKGVLVWMCDNRTASGKGARSVWPAYKRLGELELRDIEDGIAWLKSRPYVDPDRIGLSGWSYGGVITGYALTRSKTFAMGIAGAPVTDWRSYDSIYTERYMRLPANNPEGYQKASLRAGAAHLTGKLLLLHGSIDDNVHLQNTLQLAYDLQNAGRAFRMMIYPKSRHSISEPLLTRHLRATMLAFIEEALLRSPARDAAVAQP